VAPGEREEVPEKTGKTRPSYTREKEKNNGEGGQSEWCGRKELGGNKKTVLERWMQGKGNKTRGIGRRRIPPTQKGLKKTGRHERESLQTRRNAAQVDPGTQKIKRSRLDRVSEREGKPEYRDQEEQKKPLLDA